MRVICALQVPGHTAVARFRQRHQDSVRELFTQVLLSCAKAGPGRLGAIAIDGTKIAANVSRAASCRRTWLQEQVDTLTAEAAAVDEAEDAALGTASQGTDTPRQLRCRQERHERIRRCLEEVKAEEAARGQDEQSVAVRAQARVEWARQGRSGGGPLPPGADPVAVATARTEAARQCLHEAQARKRERIAEVRIRSGWPGPVRDRSRTSACSASARPGARRSPAPVRGWPGRSRPWLPRRMQKT
ncbi:hypothetical protein ACWCZ5_30940 [Streptomyces sp. NPDC001667]